MDTQAGLSTAAILTNPHHIRITDHGKIHSFVSFALKFLQENPERPLVFHTLPSADTKHGTAEPPVKKRKLATPTLTIPRLVSVIEIVKREYGKWAAMRKVEGAFLGESSRAGLHQYNELACLENLGLVAPQNQQIDDAEQLKMLLEGKNYLKQKYTPHLKVTLSVRALPTLEEKGATHQAPAPLPTISKSAKARQRKRQKKIEAERMSPNNVTS